MRQNFIVDNIKIVDNFNLTSQVLSTIDSSSPPLNLLSVLQADGVTNMGAQLVVDCSHDFLLSFDISKDNPAAYDHVVVATYVASVPNSSFQLQTTRHCLFYPDVVNGVNLGASSSFSSLRASGRCVVPALPVGAGESQYVVIGFIGSAHPGALSVYARAHIDDVTVFDPLRN